MPTAALALAGATAIGGATSGFGQIMGGIQQQRESQAEATMQEQAGQVEGWKANANIVENDYQTRKELGALNANASAAGVRADSGSVKAVRSLDESMAILRDTYSRYQGTMAQNNAYYQARATRYAGKQAMESGLIGGASSLLTSGLQAYGMYKYGQS